MALKTYKPTTPGQRGLVLIDRSELWKGRPVKSLTEGLTSARAVATTPDGSPCGGVVAALRSSTGSWTSSGTSSTCRARSSASSTIPNRTAFIALIGYADGEQAYILAPQRLAVGDA